MCVDQIDLLLDQVAVENILAYFSFNNCARVLASLINPMTHQVRNNYPYSKQNPIMP